MLEYVMKVWSSSTVTKSFISGSIAICTDTFPSLGFGRASSRREPMLLVPAMMPISSGMGSRDVARL